MENDDWLIRNYERRIAQETFLTDMKKERFINEIKDGLGETIKEEPNTIQKKPTFWQKLKKLF